ncbi:hypothetical protein, partial [Neisseria dumasiana]|uniref:hypothetical protein n=1 Tax=Neisseria dumasiana TaxID=1931275 RepID=UPI001C5B9686
SVICVVKELKSAVSAAKKPNYTHPKPNPSTPKMQLFAPNHPSQCFLSVFILHPVTAKPTKPATKPYINTPKPYFTYKIQPDKIQLCRLKKFLSDSTVELWPLDGLLYVFIEPIF